MKRYFKLIICFTMLTSNPLIASDITGEGYGKSAEQARKQALAALSDAISVEVKSDFAATETHEGMQSSQSIVRTQSNLPILGAKIDLVDQGKEYYCLAALNKNAATLYTMKINSLLGEIKSLKSKIENTTSSKQQYLLYHELLTATNQLTRYQMVADVLGSHSNLKPGITSSAIKSKLLSLGTEASDLDFAAILLTQDIKKKNVLASPAVTNSSHEITPFSRALRDRIAARLNTVSNHMEADYFFKGSYEVLKKGIYVTYQLADLEGNIIATRSVKLQPPAYQSYAYKPETVSFDKLLHEGVVVSNDFRVDINTNRGSENLLFIQGDEVELFVKLNRKGYFYIVSHVSKKSDSSSYLLELSESSGNRKFVQYVNADDANRWISLGRFEVAAPFGVESLQVIASTQDLVNKVPDNVYDNKTELYIVGGGSVEDAVIKTRGLKPKKNSNKKVYSSESVLMMTTHQK